MYQLNPATLDSTDYKLDNTVYKNKTLKNKNVKFDIENNVNRNNFNYNYNANNKINNTSDKKIKNLSNIISKLHNKTEQDEDLEVDYVHYKDLYHTKDKFLDDTNIYSNSKELDFNTINDNSVIEDNNKNSYNIQDNINEDTDLMNYNKNYNTINYSNVDYKKMIEFNNRILSKIDNILNLLEEQKMVKTRHITEELILYLFLGIFIIYILDSFVKVSKYTR